MILESYYDSSDFQFPSIVPKTLGFAGLTNEFYNDGYAVAFPCAEAFAYEADPLFQPRHYDLPLRNSYPYIFYCAVVGGPLNMMLQHWFSESLLYVILANQIVGLLPLTLVGLFSFPTLLNFVFTRGITRQWNEQYGSFWNYPSELRKHIYNQLSYQQIYAKAGFYMENNVNQNDVPNFYVQLLYWCGYLGCYTTKMKPAVQHSLILMGILGSSIYEVYLRHRVENAITRINRIRSSIYFMDHVIRVRISPVMRIMDTIPVSNFVKAMNLQTSSFTLKALTWIEHVVSLIYTVMNSTTSVAVVALKNFINLLGPAAFKLYDPIKNFIFDFLNGARPVGLVDDMSRIMNKMFTGDIRDVMNDPFGSEFVNFIGTLVSLPVLLSIFTTGSFTDFISQYREYGKIVMKEGPAFLLITSCLVRALKFGFQITTGTIAPADPDEITQWVDKALTLINKANLVDKISKEYTNSLGIITDLIVRLKDHLKEGQLLLSIDSLRGTHSSALRRHLENVIKELKECISILAGFINSVDVRFQPANVVWVGEPGSGKTNFTEITVQQHASQFGLSKSHSNRYNIPSGDKFYSNFKNADYGILNDPQMTDPKLQGIDPNVENLGHVISNEGMAPLMPEAHEKGKYAIGFQLVVINANTPDFALSDHLTEPWAFKRRLKHVIEPVLRGGYKDEMGQALPEARDIANAYYFHRWQPIRHPNPMDMPMDSKWRGYKKLESPSGSLQWSFKEIMEDMRDYFDRHHKSQETYLSMLKTNHALCEHGILSIACNECDVQTEIPEATAIPEIETDGQLLNKLREKHQAVNGHIQKYKDEVYDVIFPYAQPLTAIACSAAVLSGFYSVYKHNNKESKPMEGQPVGYWDHTQVILPPACVTTSREQLITAIDNNITAIASEYADGTANRSQLVHLQGPYYLAPYHIVHNAKLIKVWGTRSSTYSPQAEKPVFIRVGEDLAVVKSYRDPPSGKGIYHFLYAGDLPPTFQGFVRLGQALEMIRGIKLTDLTTNSKVRYGMQGVVYENVNVVSTSKFVAKTGTCGSLLVGSFDKGSTIVGFIVASSKTRTFFERFDLARINEAMEELKLGEFGIPTGKPILNDSYFSTIPTRHPRQSPVDASTTYVKQGYARPLYNLGKRYKHSHGKNHKPKCKKSEVCSDLERIGMNANQFVAPEFHTKRFPDGSYDNENSTRYKSAMFYMQDKPSFDFDLTRKVLSEIEANIIAVFEKHKVEPYRELTIFEAINGTSKQNGLDVTTSWGFPNMGPKTAHMNMDPWKPGDVKTWQLKDLEQEDFDRIMALSRSGEWIGIPFIDTDKEEVVSPLKNAKGETRTFCCSSFFGTARERVVKGWFLENYKIYGLELESAWGRSPKSKDWADIYHSLVANVNCNDRFIAGDFSKFDKNFPAEIRFYLENIIYNVCKHFDDDEVVDKALFKSTAWDVTWPVIAANGDATLFSGNNTSGSYLTTLMNDLYNKFLHRYVFYKVYPNENYDENVVAYFYGDDSILTCKLDDFNQKTLQVELANCGMKYTDAAKNANITKYTHQRKLIFLGRGFHEHGDKVLSPLRGSAWVKELCWLSPEKSVTEEERVHSYWKDLMLEVAETILSTSVDNDDDQEFVISNLGKIIKIMSQHYLDLDFFDPREDPEQYVEERWTCDEPYVDFQEGIPCSIFINSEFNSDDEYELAIPCSQQAADPVTTSDTPGKIDKQTIVTFADQTEEVGEEEVTSIGRIGAKLDFDVYPEFFLSRLVKLGQIQWSTADSGMTFNINAFTHYLKDPAVAAFLRNYTLISADQCLKFVSNGNNFMQARAAIGYQPLRPEWNKADNRPRAIGGSTGANSNSQRDVITMLPGPTLGINVGMSETVTFKIPFVAPNPWNEIATTNKDTILGGGKYYDQVNFVSMVAYAPMRMSNGAAATADITIYTWLENVKLAGPAVVPASALCNFSDPFDCGHPCGEINPEASKAEEQQGVVSSISSKVALAANALSDIPVIGGVANTVKKVANTTTKIAKFFGFSIPERVEPPEPFIAQGLDALSLTIGKSNSHLLALDPTCGLNLNPSLLGFEDSDPMSIGTMTSRWSLLTTANFNTGEPIGTALFGYPVTPINFHQDFVDIPKVIQPSSSSFAAYPFTYWRGSIEYMCVPICATNQRGRIAWSFSPNSDSHNGDPSNEQYNIIQDLAADKPFVFRVPWMQPKQYLKVQHLNSTGTISNGAATLYDPIYHNGTIEANVLNALVSPDPTVSVDLLLFYRMGPDCEFALPKPEVLSYGTPASEEIGWPCSKMLPADAGRDETFETIDMGPGADMETMKMLPHIYFGERIVSFRQLVKRFTYYFNWTNRKVGADSDTVLRTQLGWHPVPYANSELYSRFDFTTQAHFVTAGTWQANTSYMSYLRPAYMGWRGSIRRKLVYSGELGQRNLAMRVRRGTTPFYGLTFPFIEEDNYILGTDGGNALGGGAIPSDGAGGMLSTRIGVNKLEYTIPYYTNVRYSSTTVYHYRPLDVGDDMEDGIRENGHAIEAWSAQYFVGDMYVAAGEDYDLLYYLGAPAIASGTKEAY